MDTVAQLTSSSPWQAFSTLIPPWRQKWLPSSTSSSKGTQEDTLGFTSSAGSSHNPLGREREKSRWKLHVSCQLDLTADQEHGERKLSLLLERCPRKVVLYRAGTSLQSPSVPCSGAVTELRATAAPGSGLAPPRPADASSSSSPGWPFLRGAQATAAKPGK